MWLSVIILRMKNLRAIVRRLKTLILERRLIILIETMVTNGSRVTKFEANLALYTESTTTAVARPNLPPRPLLEPRKPMEERSEF